jgi:hypothetical protein
MIFVNNSCEVEGWESGPSKVNGLTKKEKMGKGKWFVK